MMRTPEDFRLLAGREFSELLGSDPELKRLDALKYDKGAETRVLLEVLGASRCYIGELPVKPLTAARWAFLWMLDCPFVTGGTLDAAQLDATLYVMSLEDLRKMTCGLSDLPGIASGYAAATGASPEEICEGIRPARVVATQIGGSREVPVQVLAEDFRKAGCRELYAQSDVAGAFEHDYEFKGDGMLFCVGSLYLAGELKDYIGRRQRGPGASGRAKEEKHAQLRGRTEEI